MKTSAGILLFRERSDSPEVLLGHPGGPFFRNKDIWSVPKGGADPSEDLLSAARREFLEETNIPVAEDASFLPLGTVKQDGRKLVHVWGVEASPGFALPRLLQSQLFTLEWPPGSGLTQEFPELDRIAFFPLDEARRKILEAQLPFLDRLTEQLEQRYSTRPHAVNL